MLALCNIGKYFTHFAYFSIYIWGEVFKNGLSKICGRQPLKNLNWYGLPQQVGEEGQPIPAVEKLLNDIEWKVLIT